VEFIGMNKIIAELTPESTRNRGIATSTIARNLGSAIGVLTGGILSFWLPLEGILVIALILFVPSLISLVKTIGSYRIKKFP
jgi:MFS family permease